MYVSALYVCKCMFIYMHAVCIQCVCVYYACIYTYAYLLVYMYAYNMKWAE